MAPSPSTWSRERVRFTAGSAVAVVTAFVVITVTRNIFLAAHQIIGWAVASSVVAVLLAPVIAVLSRYVRRGLAVLLTMLAVAGFTAAVLIGLFADIRGEVDRLKEVLPSAAAEIEADPTVGEVALDFALSERIQAFIDDIDGQVSERTAIEGAVGTIPTYFVNAILVVFLLAYGERMWDGLLRQIADDDRRERFAHVTLSAVERGRRYVLAVLAEAIVLGGITATIAWYLELPGAGVLGLVVAVLGLVPYLGVLFGAVPVLLLAAGFEPAWVTVALAVTFVVLQVASVLVLRRTIDARTLRVGPAVIVVAALVGFEVYGLGGAFYATALAVFAVAALEEATPAPAVQPA